MPTKNQIIEELYRSKDFNDCINKLGAIHLRDDLKSEVILRLLEMPDEIFNSINNARYFAVRCIIRMVENKYDPFYKTFISATAELNGYEAADDIPDHTDREIKEQLEDTAISEIDSLYWYDAEMIRLYMSSGTFRAMQKATGIPHISCFKNVKKSMEVLKGKVAGIAVTVFSKEETKFIQNHKP